MKAFLDTSVLVASFYGDHQHHERSLALFLSVRKSFAGTAAHCLVEFYAAVTGMPGKNRAQPPEAQLFLSDVRDRLTLIALDGREYAEALEECANRGTSGGAVYDAIIAACALKAKSQTIYTWNIRHFQRLGPQLISRVKEP